MLEETFVYNAAVFEGAYSDQVHSHVVQSNAIWPHVASKTVGAPITKLPR